MITADEGFEIYKQEVLAYASLMNRLKESWKGEWMNADWNNLISLNTRLDAMEVVLGLTTVEIDGVYRFRKGGPTIQPIRG